MHRRTQRANARLLLRIALSAVLVACGDDAIGAAGLGDLEDAGDDGGAVRRDGSLPDIGGRAGLTVTGIQPKGGPFSGGNSAVVRGSGFTEDALVWVGGRMVQPRDTVRIDRNSLSIIVPAGEVGLADVTVRVGDDEATRQDAYTYNALLIEPNEGSIAGGTSVLVTSSGPAFDDSTEVTFDGEPCTDVRLETPTSLRCKTPRGAAGAADVVSRTSNQGDAAPLEADDGFTYIDFTSTTAGGLSGGPIDGAVNVTVIDAFAGLALPGAFVMLGDDVATTPYRDFTDTRGQVTFSDEGLGGPITIHVALECFERVSFVAFDARNVTVELTPLLDPTCIDFGDLEPGGGRGTAGSIISGELVFPGTDEFWVNGWDFVPEPRANEQRVAYVYTTRARVDQPNPNPLIGDTIGRIVEDDAPRGERGYPYSIFARPAGLAVYAIAGLERRDTGELTPYVMGVTRDLVTSPGEELAGVDIEMTMSLDRLLDVAVQDLPDPTPRGPSEVRVQAHIDLGGEGVIVREVNGERYDKQGSRTGGGLFPFYAQPAFTRELLDASYELTAGYYSTDSDSEPPLSMLRRRGVVQASEPELIGDLLEIPRAVEPLEGALLSADRVLRWEVPGTPPDFYIVSINAGASFSWRQLVPGSETASVIPDLTSIPEVGDAAPGVLLWSVEAVRMPDFVFNELRLDMLLPRLYSHYAANVYTMRR